MAPISAELLGVLPLFHRPVKVETTFPDWVRSFELSFALLPFVVTESLELSEVSLFRRFRLVFFAALLQLPDYVRQLPSFEHILNLILSSRYYELSKTMLTISDSVVKPNPEILMHSGAPLTFPFSDLYLCMNFSEMLLLDHYNCLWILEEDRQTTPERYSGECGIEHVTPCWHGPPLRFCCCLERFSSDLQDLRFRSGVGPLSGKGLRVIVSTDVSILPQPVFIHGGATGAALREMNLNAFIRTNDPRKVRIVERARTENERPIMTVAKHHTVTLLPTSVLCPSGELCRNPNNHFTSL
ncbi:hypothetical protein Tco_0155655 [Tanacetum coccineum]